MNNKLLGIDYGDKRVGLALAEQGSIAVPFKVIENNADLMSTLQEIVGQEDIVIIVVGLPHSLSGQPNDRLKITEQFIEELKKNVQVEIATVDEQLTSKLFEKMGVNKDIDKYAAQAILDTYLEQQNGGK